MFRNSRFGSVLAAITLLLLLGIVGFGSFQLGLSQGAGATVLESGAAAGPYAIHSYAFSPFFWGFGFFRFLFTLLIFFLILRIIVGIGMRSAFRQRWAHGPGRMDGDWHEHIRKVHDRLHEEDTADSPAQHE